MKIGCKRPSVYTPLCVKALCDGERSSDSGCRLLDSVEQTSLGKVGSLSDSIEVGVCALHRERYFSMACTR